MIPIPAGCARFLCYGWIITGVYFVLGLNKNGEDLSGAGLMAIGPDSGNQVMVLWQEASFGVLGAEPLA
jgi:hypothetical protein